MTMLKRLLKRLPFCVYPYKPYMHKYKCIFIHIPKNAGSSVMKALGDSGGRFHVESEYYNEVNDYFYKKYHRFAIVRHPLERLFSAYKYSLQGGNGSQSDKLLADKIKSNSHDFASFIDCLLDMHFIMQHKLFKPQYLFVCKNDLTLNIDTVLHFEKLAEQWPAFAKKHNLPNSLEFINRSEKVSLPILTSAQYKKINQLYYFDFERFGYTPIDVN